MIFASYEVTEIAGVKAQCRRCYLVKHPKCGKSQNNDY